MSVRLHYSTYLEVDVEAETAKEAIEKAKGWQLSKAAISTVLANCAIDSDAIEVVNENGNYLCTGKNSPPEQLSIGTTMLSPYSGNISSGVYKGEQRVDKK